jgi:epoxyqueuosine reductase QueG
LGVVGMNGLLFVPGLGSSLSIGAVFTDAPLSDGIDFREGDGSGYCHPCGECVRRCPTGALTYQSGKRGFEPLKCLAYLRQKENAPLAQEGNYGCDICQDVCPMNVTLVSASSGVTLR